MESSEANDIVTAFQKKIALTFEIIYTILINAAANICKDCKLAKKLR